MSIPTQTTIACPRCGTEQDFFGWESINSKLDPELKQKLLSGELTRVLCEKCGWTGHVDYPLLYHDMTRKLMIWFWLDPTGPNLAPLPKAMMGQYTLRVVNSRNTLVEKILIFDAHLDDRVIELIKLLLIVQQHEAREPLTGELFFARSTEGPSAPSLYFEHCGHNTVETFAVPKTHYQGLTAALASNLAKPQFGKWLRIDAEYAQSLTAHLGS